MKRRTVTRVMLPLGLCAMSAGSASPDLPTGTVLPGSHRYSLSAFQLNFVLRLRFETGD